MPVRGQSFALTYLAFNTSTGAPQVGDAAHHTLKLNRDGVESTPTNAPTNASAGESTLVITAAEADASLISLYGTSSTANVILVPARVETDPPTLAIESGDPADLAAAALANAMGPKSVTVDGVNTTQHDLSQQIEMDRYLASKAAAARGGLAGVRHVRMVPPGAAGVECDPTWRWRT